MKPESAGYLAKGRECLDAAKTIDAIPLLPLAAKEAYHAAHAFVFENMGGIKSHSSLRTMFAQVAKADPRVDRKRYPATWPEREAVGMENSKHMEHPCYEKGSFGGIPPYYARRSQEP